MASFTHYLQGTTDTEITSSDTLQFADGSFDGRIQVGNYNSSTHVKDDTDSDKSSGNTPNNNNYNDATLPIADGDCALSINFSHTESVETTSAIFYAYDGADTTVAPPDTTVYAAEGGDGSWTNAEGSGSALSLADHTSASTSHDFFIALTASPDNVGSKSLKYRLELTYF